MVIIIMKIMISIKIDDNDDDIADNNNQCFQSSVFLWKSVLSINVKKKKTLQNFLSLGHRYSVFLANS